MADSWIAVSEMMPVEHGEYWVWLVPHPPQESLLDKSDNRVFVDFPPYAGIVKTYQSKDGKMRFNCGAIEKPTHWMPFHRPSAP